MLNQDLRQQLSNDMALILLQPKGEPEFNMKALQAAWDQMIAPIHCCCRHLCRHG